MSGKLSISGGTRKDLEYVVAGIRYSTSEDMVPYQEVYANNLNDNFEFSVTVEGLEWGTPYYFCAFAKYGGNVHFGSTQSFVPEIMVGM